MSFFDTFRNIVNPIPGIGTLGQAIWGDPGEEALQKAIKANKAEYERLQPLMHQRNLNQARQQAGAYAPLNDLMGRMYGPQAKIDYEALLADPNPPGMYGGGQQRPPTDVPTPEGNFLPNRNVAPFSPRGVKPNYRAG